MIRYLLSTLLFILGASHAFTQGLQPPANVIRCETVEAEHERHAHHPKMASDSLFESEIQQWINNAQTNRTLNGVLQIPLVVHVVYDTPSQNISDAQILSQIAVMNEDFRRLAGSRGFNNSPVGADTEIEFVMAVRDPNGAATNGIQRYDAIAQGWGASPYDRGTDIEPIIKPATIWDSRYYFNIWVMDLPGGLLGYAQFPETTLLGMGCNARSAQTDGIVSDTRVFGTRDDDPSYLLFSGYDRGRTTVHEIGHWLGLRHIWGDGDCSVDDFCADTPLCDGPNQGVCNDEIACDGVTTEQDENYMDYSGDLCMNIFTQDQKARMRAVLQNSPRRRTLLTSYALIPPVGDDASMVNVTAPLGTYCTGNAITPSVVIVNNGTSNLTNATIRYQVDAGAVQSFSWTGNLTTGDEETVSLPAITSAAGAHTFRVFVELPNGVTDTQTALDEITVNFTVSSGEAIPYFEDFEGGTFPPTGWSRVSVADECYTWEGDQSSIGSNGLPNESAMLNFYNYGPPNGQVDELYSPPINLTSATSAQLEFDLAHAQYVGFGFIQNDRMYVEVSTDCGATFNPTPIFDQSGAALGTVPSQSSSFVPDDASDWDRKVIDLTPFVGNQVILRFVTENDYGNNLFLDNFRVTGSLSTCVTYILSGSTTPTTCGAADGSFTVSSLSATTDYEVSTDGGTTFGAPQTSTAAGELTVSGLTAGTYSVILRLFSTGCQSPSATVTINEPSSGFVTTISGTTTTCRGESTVLTASGGSGYLWSTGETTASITVSPNADISYSVSVTQGTCVETASVTVTVNPNPTAMVTPNIFYINAGQSATLTASGGGTYNWSTGETTSVISVSPVTSTNYIVTVTDANGCTATAMARIIIGSSSTAAVENPLDLSTVGTCVPGFVIEEGPTQRFAGFPPTQIGDVNDDGIDDLLLGADFNPFRGITGSGLAYVVFGQVGGLNPIQTLTTLDGTNGFVISGINNGDRAGVGGGGIGDFNNDGINDIAIGADFADPNGTSSGQVYVIFGGANLGSSGTINLASLNGANGFTIDGRLAGGQLGYRSIAGADMNGDNTPDLIISALLADPSGRNNAGQAYIIFGGSTVGSTGTFNLSTLNGTNGTTINGASANDWIGHTLGNAGDFNNDGREDVFIGTTTGAKAYLIYGLTTYPTLIDLAAINPTEGTELLSTNPEDAATGFTHVTSNAGDFNNDGIDDIAIALTESSPGGRTNAGRAYVIFGSATTLGTTFDLNTINGTNGIVLNGIDSGDGLSRVQTLGDFNGDGLDDILLGAQFADPNGQSDAGETYVVFGSNSGISSPFELANLDGTNGFILNGIVSGDRTGFDLNSAGDMNGDGLVDLVTFARRNSLSGGTYVIYGFQSLTCPRLAATENSGLNADDDEICAEDSVTFLAEGGSGYVWDTDNDGVFDNATGATLTITLTTTTQVCVRFTSAASAVVTECLTVTVNPLPVITVTPSNTIITAGQSVTLTASGGTFYTWSTGATTTSITVSPTVTTAYTVTGTGANGCSADATGTVNFIQSFGLYVKTTGSDTNTGNSFDAPYATIQKALEDAEAFGSGAKIYVAAGTYYPSRRYDYQTRADLGIATGAERDVSFRIPNGVEVYGGFSPCATGVVMQDDIDSRDFDLNETVLSGDFNGDDVVTGSGATLDINNVSENAYHVVYTHDVGVSTRVDGFTIRGGNADLVAEVGSGAGWYNDGGSGGFANPSIINCTFINNVAITDAGAIYNEGRSAGQASPSFINCDFIDNRVFDDAGAVYNQGRDNGNSSPSFTNCIFSGNRSAARCGSMYNDGRNGGVSSPTIINCTFTENAAGSGTGLGGGLHNIGTGGGSCRPIIRNCIFWDNSGIVNSWYNLSANPDVTHTLVQEGSQAGITTGNSSGTTVGAGMLYGQNPLFTNSLGDDFTLLPTSVAIDLGDDAEIPINITLDRARERRIQGIAVDMGAFENAFRISVSETSGVTTNDGSICQGATVTLTASGGTAYTWDINGDGIFGDLTGANITFSPSETTQACVQISGAVSGTITECIALTIFSGFTVTASPSVTTINVGQSVTLTASCGSSFLWDTSATTTIINVSPAISTTYTVQAADNSGCTAAATARVNIRTAGFYVKLTGNDANTGSSFDDPYETVEKALEEATTFGAGSRIYVAAGTYYPNHRYNFSTGADLGVNRGSDRDVAFRIPDGVEIYGSFPASATGTATAAKIAARDFVADASVLSGDFNNDDVVTGSGSTLSITGNTENAFHVIYTRNASSATLVDGFTIRGGHADGTVPDIYGGGWFNDGRTGSSPSNPTMNQCYFYGNASRSNGTCVYNYGMFGGNAGIYATNCSFVRNSGGNGGGIYNNGRDSGTSNSTVINCIFSGNRVRSDGGALFNNALRSGQSNTTVSNCTFSNNSAVNRGGAMFGNGVSGGTSSFNVSNSIFWDNLGTNGGDSWYNNQATLNISQSLVQEANQTTITTGDYAGTTVGAGMIYATDPLFVDAANDNVRLSQCSPAINIGNNADIPAGITTDLDQNPRIEQTTVDLGAYESNYLLPEVDFVPVITNAGSVTIGNSVVLTYVVTNSGSGTLTISDIVSSNTPTFAIQNAPATIAAGATGTFEVVFAPSVSGTVGATITINNDDCDEPLLDFPLRGTGILLRLAVEDNSGNTPNDGEICLGESVTLTAANGTSYAWDTDGDGIFDNATDATLTITPTATLQVCVQISGTASGTVTECATITVLPNPTATITPSNTTIVVGQSVSLTASGSGSYTWNTGATSSVVVVSPTTTTTYLVTVSSASGCTAQATATVNVTAPDIDVSGTATTDFGVVNVGSSATLTYIIENTGSATLTITSISPSGSTAFTNDPVIIDLAPGATTTLTVTFA
ncbi:MAG: choice-of-anchor D domain-containing protein, partial [Bacteroidota bacterium]